MKRVRLNKCKSVEIDQILTNQRHSSLKSDFGNLYQEIQQWFQKFTLIQRLNKNLIRYVEISKILFHENKSWTFQDIDEIVRKYFENKSCQEVLSMDRTFTDKCISSPSRNTHLNDFIEIVLRWPLQITSKLWTFESSSTRINCRNTPFSNSQWSCR